MADDGHRQQSNPPPLGGAAMRQIRGRDHNLMTRPPPQAHEDVHGTWTQFSGMPQNPGSPTALHGWLHSVDDGDLSSSTSSGFHSYTSPAPGDARSSPLDGLASTDFMGSRRSPDMRHGGSAHGNLGQFDFPTDFSIPADLHRLNSMQFGPATSVGQFCPSAADLGLPPHTDFSQPPPDFHFPSHSQPDFTRPPPSFVPEVPHFPITSSAADMHSKSVSDPFSTYSNSAFSHGGSFFRDGRLASNPTDFSDSLPNLQNSGGNHFDVSVPPPAFSPFPVMADDIIFPDNGVMDGQERSKSRGSVPAHKKMVRQSSEPMYKGTTAEEGKAMYVEALRRLNSFGPTGPSYEPFGSGLQVSDEPLETSSTGSTESKPVSRPASRQEPAKMSYSDVAKAAKGKAAQAKLETSSTEKVESEPAAPRVIPDNSLPPRFRQAAANRQAGQSSRPGGHRSKTGDGGLHANSRYGLDQFEDVADLMDGRSSVESLSQHAQQLGAARRSSNSSLSSSTSAVDDGLYSKPNSSGDGRSTRPFKDSKPSSRDSGNDHSVYTTNSAPNLSSGDAGKPRLASATAAPQKGKSEKLFFDPKRIFQSRSTAGDNKQQAGAGSDKARKHTDSEGKAETVLNNGKPNNITSKATATTQRKADYINNDLREGASPTHLPSTTNTGTGAGAGASGKRTNQTSAFGRHGHKKHSGKDGGSSSDKSKGGDSRGRRRDSEHPEEDNSFFSNIDWNVVDEWMKYISDCSMSFARNSLSAVLTLLFYLIGIIMYLAVGGIHLITLALGKLWSLIRTRIFKDQGPGPWGGSSPGPEPTRRRFGLEENITLPATGEEAMKRLLACKGKDPYSILGLRADATDEDIKRYYRRQAVLVHPDKNTEPGAEEAFKILGHAFEKIGDATKRKEYDTHIFEASEAEAAMREFSDLLTKLQEKVQEAANLMRCDHCGGKHRRIPVDRPWYSARFCDRCNMRHSAKEGDVWAESSMLGFLWHYYACMEYNVYDITEWVSCQRENFKQMKANAHPVLYRIQTDGNRRHRQGQSGEGDLEDFINRLFTKAQESGTAGNSSYPSWQYGNQQGGASGQAGWGSNSAAPSAGSSSSKRSRRKKKRN